MTAMPMVTMHSDDVAGRCMGRALVEETEIDFRAIDSLGVFLSPDSAALVGDA